MNWLYFIVRIVFGLPRGESGDPQRVAIRPDGSTTTVPPDVADDQRSLNIWDWLLPQSFWRNRSLIVHSVKNFFQMLRRKTSSDDAERRKRHKYRR